jgi:hypothetical protein
MMTSEAVHSQHLRLSQNYHGNTEVKTLAGAGSALSRRSETVTKPLALTRLKSLSLSPLIHSGWAGGTYLLVRVRLVGRVKRIRKFVPKLGAAKFIGVGHDWGF